MAKLGNLASRLLVAAVALPVLVWIFYREQHAYTWAVVFIATLIAMYEFFAMTLEDALDRWASMFAGGAVATVLYWWEPVMNDRTMNPYLLFGGPTVALILAVIPIALYYLFRFGDMETVSRRLSSSITGIVYVAVLFTFVALIKRDFGPHGGDGMVFVLAVAWAGDTGAYFAGRFLGKTKLYPAVSPKKTWAGAVGGLAVSAGAGILIKILLWSEMSWVVVLALSIPGAALGQMGDLVESLIKRSHGVKDSGALLPGHGGILDRVDALLFLGPYIYLYAILAGWQ